MLLELVKRNLQNLLILERRVSDCDSSGWVGRTQLPWRVTGYDVEHSASDSLLCIYHLIQGILVVHEVHDIHAQWDTPELVDMGPVFELFESLCSFLVIKLFLFELLFTEDVCL
jgi:hypothetical protein